MAVETAIVDTWLAQRLSADSSLLALVAKRPDLPEKPGIYDEEAAERAAFPYVVFQATDPGRDVVVTGANRMMVSTVYVVKGVMPGRSYNGALRQIADRIDTLLHGTQGPVAGGGYIVSCAREGILKMPELAPGGASYRHLGGIYRIDVQS